MSTDLIPVIGVALLIPGVIAYWAGARATSFSIVIVVMLGMATANSIDGQHGWATLYLVVAVVNAITLGKVLRERGTR